ncbi:ECF RNA polymerase sigma factor SigK [Nocardia sp. NPDC052566]|uniref:ECF RNA polymerase sigma factor SigK n=1 Tax=Nocardia sp. NPDC052566 TaxID=3364330 RepID=UPI0037C8C994
MVIRARAVHGASTALGATPEALIRRVAEGDEQAFAELYDVVAAPVLGLVTRVLRDRARSEEVAQEVLLEIWLKAAQFGDRGGSVLAWALTIAHHRAVDRVRYERAAAERDQRAGQLAAPAPFDEVVETAIDRMEHEQVRAALDDLTELQRRSIVLAYYGGYTYREVSEALDKPVGTIKTRMRDGLNRLRESLGVRS